MTPDERNRLSLDLEAGILNDLRSDVEQGRGAVSLTDYVRKALRLMRMVLDAQEAGGRVLIENGDGRRTEVRFL